MTAKQMICSQISSAFLHYNVASAEPLGTFIDFMRVALIGATVNVTG